jgi:hypothetical protein
VWVSTKNCLRTHLRVDSAPTWGHNTDRSEQLRQFENTGILPAEPARNPVFRQFLVGHAAISW